ncbi:reverse transcriptase domain-containing protein [Tanacetum coccineum]
MDGGSESCIQTNKGTYRKLPSSPASRTRRIIVLPGSSKEAISTVLMTEREARQMPIYFVSRALRGPEINYIAMEKFVLALVHASKRLRRYFQAHPITAKSKEYSVERASISDLIVERPEEEGQDDSAKKKKSTLPARWDLCSGRRHLALDGCGADEQTGRKSKQESGRRNKSKAGQRQQELVGRDLSRALGTPYHDQIQTKEVRRGPWNLIEHWRNHLRTARRKVRASRVNKRAYKQEANGNRKNTTNQS